MSKMPIPGRPVLHNGAVLTALEQQVLRAKEQLTEDVPVVVAVPIAGEGEAVAPGGSVLPKNQFRALLKAAGFTQGGFAAYASVNIRTVNGWATGKQRIPALALLHLRLMVERRGVVVSVGSEDRRRLTAVYELLGDALGRLGP